MGSSFLEISLIRFIQFFSILASQKVPQSSSNPNFKMSYSCKCGFAPAPGFSFDLIYMKSFYGPETESSGTEFSGPDNESSESDNESVAKESSDNESVAKESSD